MTSPAQQYAIDEYLFLRSCGVGMRDILAALGTNSSALARMFERAGRYDLAQQIHDIYPHRQHSRATARAGAR